MIYIPMSGLDEIWLPIPNTIDNISPYYYISNYGLVFSTFYKYLVTPQPNHSGYLQVGLMTTDKRRVFRKIHRLELMTFLYFDGCESYQVNHKDGNKQNNYIKNLEWCTPKENKTHSIAMGLSNGIIGELNPNAKITEMQVRQIYELIISHRYSDEEISIISGCDSVEIVRLIALGKTWSYLFSNEELEKMLSTRRGHIISIEDKHKICMYYQNNCQYYNGYGSVISIIRNCFNFLNIEINNTNIRIAKRLYYRRDNPEITSLYNY